MIQLQNTHHTGGSITVSIASWSPVFWFEISSSTRYSVQIPNKIFSFLVDPIQSNWRHSHPVILPLTKQVNVL